MLSKAPALLSSLSPHKIVHVSAAQPGSVSTNSLAISDVGLVFTWGNNIRGQLGHPEHLGAFIGEPTLVKNMTEVVFVKGDCGDNVSILLSNIGEVYYAGLAGNDIAASFTKVLTLKGIVQVKAGSTWMAALSDCGDMYTWGSIRDTISEGNFFGHKDSTNLMKVNKTDPGLVESLKGNVKTMTCGWIHAGAVTRDGNTWTWGEGDTNRLGHGYGDIYSRDRHLSQPKMVKALKGRDVRQLSFTRGNEAALTENGDIYVWGGSGHGGHHLYEVPTKLPFTFAYERVMGGSVKQVSCGTSFTTVLTSIPMTLLALCVRAVAENITEYPYMRELPPDIYVTVLDSWKSLFMPYLMMQVSDGIAEYYSREDRIAHEARSYVEELVLAIRMSLSLPIQFPVLRYHYPQRDDSHSFPSTEDSDSSEEGEDDDDSLQDGSTSEEDFDDSEDSDSSNSSQD